MEIKRVFQFGKVALLPHVKTKSSLVEVEIRIKKNYTYWHIDGKEIIDDLGYDISFMGRFYNTIKTDYYCCGQCYDEIDNHRDELSNKELWDVIYRLWRKYHLKNINLINQKDKKTFLEILGIDIDSVA